MILTIALPTITPSAILDMSDACLGVLIPNPTATGKSQTSRMSDIIAFKSVFISERIPVTPNEETR